MSRAAAPNSMEYIEKVALGTNLNPSSMAQTTNPACSEHCRWYFAQDVRIITVRQRLPPDRNTPASSGQRFIALVIPANSHLTFLQRLEQNILKVQVSDTEGSQASRDLVMQRLLDLVQLKIGNALSLRGCE